MKLIGNPDWSREEWTRDRHERGRRADEINAHLIEWLMDYTREEVYRKGQALSVPVAPLYSPRDQANSGQFAARDFFQENQHKVIGRTRFPTSPCRFSESPWCLERSAPLLGEHNDEIYGDLGYDAQELEKLREEGVI